MATPIPSAILSKAVAAANIAPHAVVEGPGFRGEFSGRSPAAGVRAGWKDMWTGGMGTQPLTEHAPPALDGARTFITNLLSSGAAGLRHIGLGKTGSDMNKMARPKANDIVNMDSFGGGAADILSPGLFGGNRAGRSKQLADASGQDAGFNVTHPQWSNFLAGLPSAAIGGIAGYGLGEKMGLGNNAEQNNAIGAGIGAAGGLLASSLLMNILRRSKMREIGEGFDKAKKITPVKPDRPSVAGSILLPFGGQHNSGQAAAYQKLRGKLDSADNTGAGTAMNVLGHIPYINAPATLAAGMSGNFRARSLLADDQNTKTGQMMEKNAHDALMQKIAAAEPTERADAWEVGFRKAAEDMGLTEEQYTQFRKIAQDVMAGKA